jgi:hypothetical protein
MTSQDVRCPSCGSTSVKQIDSYQESASLSDPQAKSTSTRYTYQCECGLAFTRSVKQDDDGP